jgi:ABC-type lipoprotein release transport system permease subunit
MIAKLTWRNLWRNRYRTIITTTSVTFALMLAILMQSFKKGAFDNLIKNVVSFYSGYVQIHKTGYWDEQVLDNSFAMNDTLINRLKQNPHIKEMVPRIETFSLVSMGNNTKGCMVVGTDPEKENNLTQLKNKITSGEYFKNNEPVAMVAEGLASRLSIKENDTIVLLGQGYQGSMAAGKYKVKGIVHFGSPNLNDGLVFLPLATAQQFLSAENMLTSIALAIDKQENIAMIQKEVSAVTGNKYEVMNWEQLMPEIADHIKTDNISYYIFTGILYLIIAFGIFGTILMMTAERSYEFGMLIVIGMEKFRLGITLLGETFLITVIGWLLGVLLSLPLVIYMNKFPIRFTGEFAKAYQQFGFEPVIPTAVSAPIFIKQSLIVLIIAFIIGLYPLWHVRKIDPVTAMKR